VCGELLIFPESAIRHTHAARAGSGAAGAEGGGVSMYCSMPLTALIERR